MNGHGFVALGIYSSMDDEARISHFERFNKNRVNFLVVTDVAARGLDIPRLDCAISYDLSDEKTFVHRVGRVRGVGESVSFVTYSDVFHFFNIKETHLPEAEIGLMPQDVLDKYDMGEFKYKKQQALRGYTKCLKFRKKVSVPSEFKAKIDQFELHTKYRERETLAGQIKRMRHPRAVRTVEEDLRKHDGYRDQFYIPYSRKETLTHSSAFGVERDDYVTEQKTKERIWRRKHVGKEK
ncbi:RRP3 [Enterospora canceri]|uniref:ATP-dependent RNA helicase n=1 Tax=Enterospora canceri TaxID=1081671 RepID=A0A1Y1S6T1_9MICR|nr:RRP3 [Enterospora canceri]